MSTNYTDRLQQVTAQLRRTWLTWGLLPLAVCIVLTLLADALAGGRSAATPMHLERQFQVILAIAAGLFLIGFSLDSNWTNAQKLAKRLATAAGLDELTPEGKPKKRPEGRTLQERLIPQAGIVFESILSSTLALTVIGAAIALCAVLAAGARLGMTYASMLLILAAAYQLFVFSRHTYYREVMETAADGRLVSEVEEPKK